MTRDRRITYGNDLDNPLKHPPEDCPFRIDPASTAASVRVRIAVVIGGDGDWCSAGRSARLNGGESPLDADLAASASQGLSAPQAVYFLEADLPLPGSAVDVVAHISARARA
jgi:hypothetical protein